MKSRFRIGGSYTRIIWTNGTTAQTLAYVDNISETGPQPVAAPQAIQPMDSQYPIEIALPGALQAGTLEVQFREQWNADVWEAFFQTYVSSLNTGTTTVISDLLGVFQAQLQNTGTIQLQKAIIDPSTGNVIRQVTYNNPTIVNVMIDEQINIGTMTFPKSVQFMYTSRTVSYTSGGAYGSNKTLVTAPNTVLTGPNKGKPSYTLNASFDQTNDTTYTTLA